MTIYRYLFFGLVTFSLAQSIFYYPKMPELMASHFDASGVANGWSGRPVFFGTYFAIVTLITGVFMLIPGFSEKRNDFGIKVRNRDYWLAPERRLQTRSFFRRQMLAMGVINLLLTVFTVQLAILANLEHHTRLSGGIYWALGIYIVFVSGWLLHFFHYFGKP